MENPLRHFREVWSLDTEFRIPPGERPTPICLVAQELRSGRLIRQWLGDNPPSQPPYSTGPECLFVAYYSSAEWGCHLALGWPMPQRILDLFVEFSWMTSGLSALWSGGRSLLGAMSYHGLDAIDAAEKEGMRDLAMRGGPYTDAEQLALLDYCQSDVDSLARLLPAMLPKIDLTRALIRGRYMAAAARMEWAGVPIDREGLDRLQRNWDPLKARLIAKVNEQYGVYAPTDQRTIDPTTRLGAAILREASASEVDPQHLARAVEEVWKEERAIHKDLFEAREKARKATGLTPGRIDRWEDSGKDHSRYPGLDTMARELARELPLLGIGSGYSGAEGYDDSDYAGDLWDLLKTQDEKHKPKHHPDILRRAADLVRGSLDHPRQCGSFTFSATRFASYLTQHEIPWPRLGSVPWPWMTRPSGRWPRPIQPRSDRCGSCGTPSAR